jgi:hypothetical protein
VLVVAALPAGFSAFALVLTVVPPAMALPFCYAS